MARYFLDSSALVKRYRQESGSEQIRSLFDEPNGRFFISRLAIVELVSAFSRLVREAVLDRLAFDEALARLDADVQSRIIIVVVLNNARLTDAREILRLIGSTQLIRTLDAIHLATAQALHARRHLAAFVTADQRLLAVASQSCGLPILDVS